MMGHSTDSTVKVEKMESMENTQDSSMITVTCHTKPVVSLKPSINNEYISTASADTRCCIINRQGEVISTFQDEYGQGLNDCAWVSDKYIVTGSDDHSIKLWSIEKSKCLMTMKDYSPNQGAVLCLDVNKYNKNIYAGSIDGKVAIYDISQQSAILYFSAHSDPVSSISGSNDGIDFTTGGNDGITRIWDSRFLSCCKYTIGTNGNSPICCVRYSPNGKFLLVQSLDSTIRLFRVDSSSTFGLIREYTGHVNEKYLLQSCFYSSSLSSESKEHYIISGSENEQIYLWNVKSIEPVRTIRYGDNVKPNVIYSVATMSNINNSNQIIASSSDGTIKMWNISNL